MAFSIAEWIKDIVHGCGGFEDYERYEIVIFKDREAGLVDFVLRSLANPKCKGSEEMLNAIIERRAMLSESQDSAGRE